MGTIEKGVILTLEGELDRNKNYTQAKVQATTAKGAPTLPLTIPWYLRGSMGRLEKGTEIAYALFDDASGVILSRMDGEWSGKLEEQELNLDVLGKTVQIKGNVAISEKLEGEEIISHNISLSTHRHRNSDNDSEYTDMPDGGVLL